MLRVSPIFILLFVGAAVLTAFGIHQYMQQKQMVSGQSSFSSEIPPTTIERIENIPGDWNSRKKASDEGSCSEYAADGNCLQERE